MINNDLEVNFHNGSMTTEERKIFYEEMTQHEMFGFSDKVKNLIAGKSYSSISMAHRAEDRVMMDWAKYNRV